MVVSPADEIHARILIPVNEVEKVPYDGEAVDQLQKALQRDALARSSGHASKFAVAALLRDVSHTPVVQRDPRLVIPANCDGHRLSGRDGHGPHTESVG